MLWKRGDKKRKDSKIRVKMKAINKRKMTEEKDK
jgi:hypothetical protein